MSERLGSYRPTDIDRITDGLKILAEYDPTGDVSASYQAIIYAGPDGGKVTAQHGRALVELGWQYDDDVRRWGYQ